MTVHGRYDDRRERFAAERDTAARHAGRLANRRLVTFLAAIVLILLAVDLPAMRPLLLAGAGMAIVVFVLLVRASRAAERAMRRLDALVAINREGAARAVRSWTQLPDPDAVEVGEDHPYAHDLDLFGHASVMQLLGTVATAPGRETLSRWLGAPAPADVIRDRQDAVAELAPALDFRQALAADGRTAGRISAARIQRFLEWADDVHPGQGTRGITAARIAGPLLGVSAVWLFGTWILGGNAAGVVWIVPVLLNAWLTSIYRHRVEASLGPVSANAGAFQQYADILETMDGREFTATALREIRTAIRHEGQSAHQRLRKLYSLVHLADLRHSSAHGLIQIFTLWDLHVLVGLERWKHESGRLVRRWMRSLGEMEALSALAGLAHDQPEWVYPTVDENALGTMEGENVGHPLLPDAGRVSNDVAIGLHSQTKSSPAGPCWLTR